MKCKHRSWRTPVGLKRRWASLLLVSALLVATGVVTNSPSPAFAAASGDWPQLGHDPQRTNYTSVQVDPPYCYTWKWDEVPIASRAQPVVADGRLFIGSMNGLLYARNASTGAPLWSFASQGPIRHSAGVAGSTVVFSSHDGYTYGLNVANGALQWKTYTGPSQTAPLMDEARGWVYVASSSGRLTALSLANGAQVWQYDSGAPILTSPALSSDGQTVFLGNEDIRAIAVRASDGGELWRTSLQGQSLADRYPVVAADKVIYRSQPLYFFHLLLHEGDDIMDQAGSVNSDWAADWSNVKPRIVDYLTAQPAKQTFFALNAATGASSGVAPVLYTFGVNEIPNTPVIRNGSAYVAYRARHGIQTDGGSVHVTSRYDAELGQMNVGTLDIAGLRQANYPGYHVEFRMTSDEPAVLSMGGDILWVDNWERLGGLNVSSGQLIHVGAVSNDWPECGAQCGPGTSNPFFPLSGNSSDPAYPFPPPHITEGDQRGGVVIANSMLYWHVIAGGLAGISHRAGSSCPAPLVYTTTPGTPSAQSDSQTPEVTIEVSRPLADYVTLDLTAPAANPPADLVTRLREEVRAIVTASDHLMPFYLERGFSQPFLWPYNVPSGKSGLPTIAYINTGNAYWHDPGELLYTVALAYPYLDAPLQASAKQYMAAEMNRYPPLQDLPWANSSSQPAWLKQGVARERYTVPFRSELNNWPPPAASMSALYAVWLWSKNTGDWSYAQSHWTQASSLFNSRRGSMKYYADIAGAIGYARLATHFGDTNAYNSAVQTAVAAMQTGQDFATFRNYAQGQYLDYGGAATGLYVPVFYGMTPEVGLYLREQTGSQAANHLTERETGDVGLRWWYLTRVGSHAEPGETSYVAPIAAWSHFLAHAYVVGDSQDTLRGWLDRSWARGDLYSIQKIAAVIGASSNGLPPTPTPDPTQTPTPTQTPILTQTPTPTQTQTPTPTRTPAATSTQTPTPTQTPTQTPTRTPAPTSTPTRPPAADLHLSSQIVSPSSVRSGQVVTYTITIRNQGGPLAETARLTDVLPSGLTYVPRSLKATKGTIDDSKSPTLRWSGVISNTPNVTISYAATVVETKSRTIANTATLDGGSAGKISLSATVVVNDGGLGTGIYLPIITRGGD
jgi:uncharacterized repeat protein (TIGR01451 family)